MTHRTPTLVLALAAVAAPACALPADRDPAAVRAVLSAQQEAWNRGDLEGYMEGYWDSDSLAFYSGGDVTRGWRPTLERYTRRYRGEGREMGRLTLEIHDLALPARGQAIVRGGWRVVTAGGEPRGLFTLWMRYLPGRGWRIVHDHTSTAP